MLYQVKPLIYTRHAKNRMRLHKVSAEEIEHTLAHPDFKQPSIKMRINVWKKLQDGKYLRIACREEPSRTMVISVARKKKPSKGVALK